MASGDGDRYISNSLIRGLQILRMFNADQPTLSLAEIAGNLGVSRTVPYRLLYTLQADGYLIQDEHTKRYELTPKVLELGFSYLNTLQLPEIARPYMEALRDKTGASSHMGILDGNEVVYVGRVPIPGVAAITVSIGTRLPAHAISMGKCLLAYQPRERIEAIFLGSDLKPYTQQTKTMLADLLNELQIIRERGYAIGDQEFESGIRSVAAPIFNRLGLVIASVSVVASAAVLNNEAMEQVVIPGVCETAVTLSQFMGFTGHRN
ncbi:IclR family transcriptional regulator [Ammoniphilus sp. YIM 78166]|uniref:IclR family transcriptional regulator n=1 Tax=Ammoniphilus sp. YIM 78166 TaxID=1644106 RepID=UPI00106FD980|nr:IclR family transcriptional regulator C-terminal domain-containing protein [Ammoniphilus sp. YIM 78166]